MVTGNTPLTGPIRPLADTGIHISEFSCDRPALQPLSNARIAAILEAHGLMAYERGTNLYAISPYTRHDPVTKRVTIGDQHVCVTGWSTRTIRIWLGY